VHFRAGGLCRNRAGFANSLDRDLGFLLAREPSSENFFGIVNALQKKTRVRLRVTAELIS
jgi:hypothetical protein